jgi:hypothetical protein
LKYIVGAFLYIKRDYRVLRLFFCAPTRQVITYYNSKRARKRKEKMSGMTQDEDKKPYQGTHINLKVKGQVFISFSVFDSSECTDHVLYACECCVFFWHLYWFILFSCLISTLVGKIWIRWIRLSFFFLMSFRSL